MGIPAKESLLVKHVTRITTYTAVCRNHTTNRKQFSIRLGTIIFIIIEKYTEKLQTKFLHLQ